MHTACSRASVCTASCPVTHKTQGLCDTLRDVGAPLHCCAPGCSVLIPGSGLHVQVLFAFTKQVMKSFLSFFQPNGNGLQPILAFTKSSKDVGCLSEGLQPFASGRALQYPVRYLIKRELVCHKQLLEWKQYETGFKQLCLLRSPTGTKQLSNYKLFDLDQPVSKGWRCLGHVALPGVLWP